VNSDLSSSNQPTVAPPGPMSRRARFAAALQHKQPDRPPFDIGATCPMSWLRDQKGLADFLGLPGEPRPVGAWGFDERIMEWADADFRGTGRIVELPGPHSRTISPMSYVNCWGIRWEFIDDEWQITGHPLEGVEDMAALQSFPWPEPRVDEALLATWVDEARSLRARGDHVVLAEHPVLGVMELGAWMFGYETYLYALAAEPDLVRHFNDRVLEIQLEVVRQYYGALGPYIDFTISGDDFGTQQSPIVSPTMFGEMIAPWFRERIRLTKEIARCPYWHHSCGSIFDLLDQILDCGVDIINPVQTSAAGMDPAALKKTFGDRVVFWGGMDVQQLLRTATEETVRLRTRELVGILGHNGGYVMAPTHEIGRDIPFENIVAWVEEMRAIKQEQAPSSPGHSLHPPDQQSLPASGEPFKSF